MANKDFIKVMNYKIDKKVFFAVLILVAVGGAWYFGLFEKLGFGAPTTPSRGVAPPTQSKDAEVTVRLYDKDGNPLMVKRVTPRALEAVTVGTTTKYNVAYIGLDFNVFNQGTGSLDVAVTQMALYKGANVTPTFTENYATASPKLIKSFKGTAGSDYACAVVSGTVMPGEYDLTTCGANAPVTLTGSSGSCVAGQACHKLMQSCIGSPSQTKCIYAPDLKTYCSADWCKIRITATGEDTVTTGGNPRTLGATAYGEVAMMVQTDPTASLSAAVTVAGF